MECKKLFKQYAYLTCDNFDHINFQLHDFGYRGVSSEESAQIGGAAHLMNFMGTDTVTALEFVMNQYNANEVVGYSVPATEHSIMTSNGDSGEEKLIGELLDKYPTGILSLVIDSYNYMTFIEICGTKFKDKILNRDGKVVFRPDSGNPVFVSHNVFNLLEEHFGSTKNSKGYRVLNEKVGMLWGDGIDIDGIKDILDFFRVKDIASSNIVFGMGGGLLQKVNRDTMRFAFKCSAQCQNGDWVDIFKDPIDDSKKSKKGRLKLIKNYNSYKTVKITEKGENILKTVFKNGILKTEYNFNDIRNI
jgi:nicotinamide phosphoribosyltransferase